MRYALILALVATGIFTALAKKPIKDEFLNIYPDADETQLTDLPSKAGHCGICHYNFDGGGNRNPYGAAIEANLSGKNYETAIYAIEGDDSDGDGFSNLIEITDTNNYANTPTFPGLSAANVGSASAVSVDDITDYLYPSSGEDTEEPDVEILSPAAGATATGNTNDVSISWTASDSGSGLASINLYISLDDGTNFSPIALNLPSTNTAYDWHAANRPTAMAVIKVEAVDNAGNIGYEESEEFFIVSPAGGLTPTTLRDFDLPGSKPLEHSGLVQSDPNSCAQCHGGYGEEHTEPFRNWLGSMMAQASVDPIFLANMTIANQDAPDSGDMCLRCHNSRGWLDGRSTPTDGSQMTDLDMRGVSCDLCHRMADPVYQPGLSPTNDLAILTALTTNNVPPTHANGMFVFDPNANRRGPYDDTASPHADLFSPFHSESAICGTCHDVSNPVFERNGSSPEYAPNPFDEAPLTSANTSTNLMPVERTYSEWLHSAYNTSNGVYAPQFAGNKPGSMVSSCQDCHMPDIEGHGADPALGANSPLRSDLPLHDMTGGSSWLARLLPHYANLDTETAVALTNGANRSEFMLRNAARMQASKEGSNLNVMVINETGHKLPTGYPEGRRMWINLRFYDESDQLIEERGGYDFDTALLTNDTMVYEIHPGIGTNLAATLNDLHNTNTYVPGKSFHFVLNNQIFEDNRIPPRGFSHAAFETFGGQPVGHHYEDGQYWDHAYFEIPVGAVRAHTRLFYQSTSKEFIEFLRDENKTDNLGQEMYDLWAANDKCPPVLMTEAFWPENFNIQDMWWTIDDTLGIAFNSISGYTYWIEYADTLSASNAMWKPFANNGVAKSHGGSITFTDDFTTATSGGTNIASRFYRIRR